MDDADVTQARLEAEDALRRRRAEADAAKPQQHFRECQECGDELPEVRRRYGCRLCVECQSRVERKHKLFGGRHANN